MNNISKATTNRNTTKASIVQAWQDFGGLLVLRGLTSLSPEALYDITILYCIHVYYITLY